MTNQVLSILTAILGALAVLLLLLAGHEVGVLTLGLWAVIGVLVSASGITTIIFVLMWFACSEP